MHSCDTEDDDRLMCNVQRWSACFLAVNMQHEITNVQIS